MPVAKSFLRWAGISIEKNLHLLAERDEKNNLIKVTVPATGEEGSGK